VRNKTKIILINSLLILSSIFAIVYLFNDWKKLQITINDIEYIEGETTFVNKTFIYGKHPEKIIYFKIQGSDLTFRILGIPYEILERKKMISKIESQKKITIGIPKSYTEKISGNLKNKILNQIITDSEKPNICYLKKGGIEIISLKEYNKLDYKRRTSNFWLGTSILSLVILITSTLIILEFKNN
jgi:hypothetical protein